MPNRFSPHKQLDQVTDPEHRYRMMAVAVRTNPRFSVLRLEIDRPGPSYTIDTLLAAVVAEAAARVELVKTDEAANIVSMSPLFSWREPFFVASFADKAPSVFAQRSPIERAVLALVHDHVTTPEKLFLEKNTFKMQFHEYDWRLNDLSNRD